MQTQARLEIPHNEPNHCYRYDGKVITVIRTDYCQSKREHLALVQVGDRLETFPCAWIRVEAVPTPEAATSEP